MNLRYLDHLTIKLHTYYIYFLFQFLFVRNIKNATNLIMIVGDKMFFFLFVFVYVTTVSVLKECVCVCVCVKSNNTLVLLLGN